MKMFICQKKADSGEPFCRQRRDGIPVTIRKERRHTTAKYTVKYEPNKTKKEARFQASAATLTSTALLWAITQRDRTDSLSRNVGKKLPLLDA
jgi:uncharacterized lipoprotein YbaY